MTGKHRSALQLRQLAATLDAVMERLEAVEELQAITCGEQTEVQEQLVQLVARVRALRDEHGPTGTAAVLSNDVFANSTAYEEYRPQ